MFDRSTQTNGGTEYGRQLESQQQQATKETRMRCLRCGKVVWRLLKDHQKAEDLLEDCLTGEVNIGGILRPHVFAPD